MARYATVDGVLLLNKPAGLTSNQALQKVRRLLNARKAGHTGSLDPADDGARRVAHREDQRRRQQGTGRKGY